MRVAVAGGAGFVGSHLCRRLLREGYEVLCLDNFSTGAQQNVDALRSSPGFELREADISRPLDAEGIDAIFNLASPASLPHIRRLAIETAMTNAVGSYHLLEWASASGARYLLASTSETYGDPEVHPQPETYWGHVNSVGERACYDEGKRFAEALTMEYVRQRDLDARIARIFNTYGPGMRPDDGRVVSNFIVQALAGGPLTIYGDGSQTRSFCYVDDLVEGLVALMDTDGARGEVVNLGNPDEYRINEFADLVRAEFDEGIDIEFLELPTDDPRRRQPDISRARELLGWEPTTPLSEGLRITIDGFRGTANSGSTG